MLLRYSAIANDIEHLTAAMTRLATPLVNYLTVNDRKSVLRLSGPATSSHACAEASAIQGARRGPHPPVTGSRRHERRRGRCIRVHRATRRSRRTSSAQRVSTSSVLGDVEPTSTRRLRPRDASPAKTAAPTADSKDGRYGACGCDSPARAPSDASRCGPLDGRARAQAG